MIDIDKALANFSDVLVTTTVAGPMSKNAICRAQQTPRLQAPEVYRLLGRMVLNKLVAQVGGRYQYTEGR